MKVNKRPPKTPSELAHYRVELNCKLARDCLDEVIPTPSEFTKTEYAITYLANAIQALADLIETKK